MDQREKEKRELAMFWEFLWPVLGATTGMVWGAIIGVAIAGIFTALAFGIIGAALGFQLGHLLGMILTVFVVSCVKLWEYGDRWSFLGGGSSSILAFLYLAARKTGPGTMILICVGVFLLGAWFNIAVGRIIAWFYRTRP